MQHVHFFKNVNLNKFPIKIINFLTFLIVFFSLPHFVHSFDFCVVFLKSVNEIVPPPILQMIISRSKESIYVPQKVKINIEGFCFALHQFSISNTDTYRYKYEVAISLSYEYHQICWVIREIRWEGTYYFIKFYFFFHMSYYVRKF